MVDYILLATIWFCVSVFFVAMVLLNLLKSALLERKITTQARVGKKNNSFVSVSFIIPVRNEAHNIQTCLENLLKTGVNGEILIVDDGSTDDTVLIAKIFAKKLPQHVTLTVISVTKPKGWIGKNYACYVGAQQAKCDTYVFIDADVRADATFLEKTAAYMAKNDISFVSVFPQQLTNTFASRFFAPMLNWFYLVFYPSFFQVFQWRILAAANGQCIIITKKAYSKVSHKDVKASKVEDLDFVSLIAKKKLSRETLFSSLVKTHMYNSVSEAIRGFSRNFLLASRMPIYLFAIWLICFVGFFYVPLVLVWTQPLFFATIITWVFAWYIVMQTSNQGILGLLYPIFVFVTLVVGIESMIEKKRGSIWKERVI